MRKEKKPKYKKGVSKKLLELCAGSDLEQHRLAKRDDEVCTLDHVIIDSDGKEAEAKEWLKLNKKNLNA